MFFKFEAQGDEIYIEAEGLREAEDILYEYAGAIPNELLTVSEVSLDEIPGGTEILIWRDSYTFVGE